MPECPNRMEDGRAFTDYRPRCAVNAELFNLLNKANMVHSSYESRMYLQQNADAFMEYEKNKAVDRAAPCCLLYTSPSPRDGLLSRMPSSA